MNNQQDSEKRTCLTCHAAREVGQPHPHDPCVPILGKQVVFPPSPLENTKLKSFEINGVKFISEIDFQKAITAAEVALLKKLKEKFSAQPKLYGWLRNRIIDAELKARGE